MYNIPSAIIYNCFCQLHPCSDEKFKASGAKSMMKSGKAGENFIFWSKWKVFKGTDYICYIIAPDGSAPKLQHNCCRETAEHTETLPSVTSHSVSVISWKYCTKLMELIELFYSSHLFLLSSLEAMYLRISALAMASQTPSVAKTRKSQLVSSLNCSICGTGEMTCRQVGNIISLSSYLMTC